MEMRRDKRYRFLLNTHPSHYEVHDLDNEQTGANECQIDEIIQGGNYKYLVGTTYSDLVAWLRNHPEYDGCKYCLSSYHRK